MDQASGFAGGREEQLIAKLTQIHRMVRQLLEEHLDTAGWLAGDAGRAELCRSLASGVLSITEKSIDMIRSGGIDGSAGSGQKRRLVGEDDQYMAAAAMCGGSPSPTSDASDVISSKMSKKIRKALPKRKTQVRVSSEAGVECPMNDGYSWRKYGQKDILGAKHPRGYYRCTHRNTQGCLATKQVQRTDDDPTLFDIFYQGDHTCGTALHNLTMQQALVTELSTPLAQLQQQEMRPSLDMDGKDWDEEALSFAFPPMTPPAGGVNRFFSLPSTPNNHNFLVDGVSPSFASSAATSESNHLPLSPCHLTGHGAAGIMGWSSESDLEAASVLMSASSSPPAADFILEDFDFQGGFDLD